MGKGVLQFQVRHDLVKHRIDRSAFLTLGIGLQDFRFPGFIRDESYGALGMARQIIRSIGQLILDITGKSPGCHFRVTVPIAAVFLTFLSHFYGIAVVVGFCPPDLRGFLLLHPVKHTLEHFQTVTLTFRDHVATDGFL